jgi:predicted RND superfamily exporter protein
MAKSYFIAFIVITCLMILLIGNFKIGLISMIPNLSPIIIALGVIGVTGIQLDLFTMMTGSIAIGLAVDDTIHFMHNFRRYHLDTGDVKQAVHQTLQSTGRAMLFTSLVLSTGFFIMIFSQMNNLKSFGFITGITILLALLADFLLAPALMAVIYKNKR